MRIRLTRRHWIISLVSKKHKREFDEVVQWNGEHKHHLYSEHSIVHTSHYTVKNMETLSNDPFTTFSKQIHIQHLFLTINKLAWAMIINFKLKIKSFNLLGIFARKQNTHLKFSEFWNWSKNDLIQFVSLNF